MVGSFGARDLSLKGAAGKLAQALTVNGIAHDVNVKEYGGAGHAFLNDHSGDNLPPIITALTWLIGARHDERSAQDARQRIVAFFDTHLRLAADDATVPDAERGLRPRPSGNAD